MGTIIHLPSMVQQRVPLPTALRGPTRQRYSEGIKIGLLTFRCPVTAHDIVFGYAPSLAQGHFSMAHNCGFTPTLLLQQIQKAPFAEIVLRRRANHELAAIARKRAPADEAERKAFLAALQL